MRKKYAWRRARIHISYTIEEAAGVAEVHVTTIYKWLRQGLAIDRSEQPHLIFGRDLQEWLKRLSNQYAVEIAQGEFYCLRCQCARTPLGSQVEYRPITDARGRLWAKCNTCNLNMCRICRLDRISSDMPGVQVAFKDVR